MRLQSADGWRRSIGIAGGGHLAAGECPGGQAGDLKAEVQSMWRAFFLALGIYVFLLGAQCLAVERFILRSRLPAPKPDNAIISTAPKLGPNRELTPREHSPWILMCVGAVVCGYSLTLPRRWAKK
jgi:hypothetical protein